jgi:hypothetical protein
MRFSAELFKASIGTGEVDPIVKATPPERRNADLYFWQRRLLLP